MQTYLLIFLGGGLGSMCRFGLAHWLGGQRLHFPWATFSANVLACFLLGLLLSLSMKGKLGGPASVLLMAGFCGGFSTFSTFSNETMQMLIACQWLRAFAYMAASLLFCLAAIYAGIRLGGLWGNAQY